MNQVRQRTESGVKVAFIKTKNADNLLDLRLLKTLSFDYTSE
jgi:hypothetical protein